MLCHGKSNQRKSNRTILSLNAIDDGSRAEQDYANRKHKLWATPDSHSLSVDISDIHICMKDIFSWMHAFVSHNWINWFTCPNYWLLKEFAIERLFARRQITTQNTTNSSIPKWPIKRKINVRFPEKTKYLLIINGW